MPPVAETIQCTRSSAERLDAILYQQYESKHEKLSVPLAEIRAQKLAKGTAFNESESLLLGWPRGIVEQFRGKFLSDTIIIEVIKLVPATLLPSTAEHLSQALRMYLQEFHDQSIQLMWWGGEHPLRDELHTLGFANTFGISDVEKEIYRADEKQMRENMEPYTRIDRSLLFTRGQSTSSRLPIVPQAKGLFLQINHSTAHYFKFDSIVCMTVYQHREDPRSPRARTKTLAAADHRLEIRMPRHLYRPLHVRIQNGSALAMKQKFVGYYEYVLNQTVDNKLIRDHHLWTRISGELKQHPPQSVVMKWLGFDVADQYKQLKLVKRSARPSPNERLHSLTKVKFSSPEATNWHFDASLGNFRSIIMGHVAEYEDRKFYIIEDIYLFLNVTAFGGIEPLQFGAQCLEVLYSAVANRSGIVECNLSLKGAQPYAHSARTLAALGLATDPVNPEHVVQDPYIYQTFFLSHFSLLTTKHKVVQQQQILWQRDPELAEKLQSEAGREAHFVVQ